MESDMGKNVVVLNDATSHIIVTGGEPTEHPKFMKMMQIIIEKLGIELGIVTHKTPPIQTNCYKL